MVLALVNSDWFPFAVSKGLFEYYIPKKNTFTTSLEHTFGDYSHVQQPIYRFPQRMFVQIMLIYWRPLGQFVFPAQHRAGAHHQTESDSSSRIQPVHESRESHPHPGASPGNSVRSVSLQARRTGLLWNIRLHHAHIHALPGEIILLVLADSSRIFWYLFIYEALTIFGRSHQWIPSYWLFNQQLGRQHSFQPLALFILSLKGSRKEGVHYLSWNGLKSVPCFARCYLIIWSSPSTLGVEQQARKRLRAPKHVRPGVVKSPRRPLGCYVAATARSTEFTPGGHMTDWESGVCSVNCQKADSPPPLRESLQMWSMG